LILGVTVAAVGVATVTALLYALKEIAPVVSLGVAYLVPVPLASAY
jgi:two-component system, OmpR family, sensor histidine kinase KdpD